MQIQSYGMTDPGRKRPANEDVFVSEPQLGVYLVCDGMGGMGGGAVAARTCADTVLTYLRGHQVDLRQLGDQPESRERAFQIVQDALREASASVFRLAMSHMGRAGMGTTATLLVVIGNTAVMGHVGDSRCYLSRGGQIHQLTDDHTFANELQRRGVSATELQLGGYKSALTRAVGIQHSVQVDMLIFDLLPGDTLLLCSDGLTRYFEDPAELLKELSSDRLDTAVHRMVGLANERGGRDNITALVLRTDVPMRIPVAEQNRFTTVQRSLDALRFVSLFHHLAMKELVQVLNLFKVQDHAPGSTVITEGEIGHTFYIVLEGHLEVSRGGMALATLEPGTHFGEMALLNDRPRSATVTATEKTRLLKMERDQFTHLIRSESDLATKLLWTFAQVLSERLIEARDQMLEQVSTVRVDTAPFSPV